jgi:hypothetical protein
LKEKGRQEARSTGREQGWGEYRGALVLGVRRDTNKMTLISSRHRMPTAYPTPRRERERERRRRRQSGDEGGLIEID